MKNKKLICNFCGIEDSEQNPVIAGDNATICQSCAKSAYDIIQNHKDGVDITNQKGITSKLNNTQKIMTPKELKSILDEYV